MRSPGVKRSIYGSGLGMFEFKIDALKVFDSVADTHILGHVFATDMRRGCLKNLKTLWPVRGQ